MTYIVGSITGTSIDGLDIALLDISTPITIKAAYTAAFPAELRELLRSLTQPGSNEIARLGSAHRKLGLFIGDQILFFLDTCGVSRSMVRAIGSHGQTIRHSPHSDIPFSLQIGDGSCIAEVTGIDTITDFRSRDIAAKGQGAPLVPIFHDAIFRSTSVSRVVLNIGGIANITVLPHNLASPIVGFDTGPGNALLDPVVQNSSSQGQFDRDGKLSRSGEVNNRWLNLLLDDPYYEQSPPKSTGKEHFNLEYVQRQIGDFPHLSLEDTLATLCELTAASIANHIKQWGQGSEQVIVCGGGRQNTDLLERLRRRLVNTDVLISEQLGVDGDAIEAAAFAYLAWRFLESETGNVPSVTGASGPRPLGSLYRG